VNILPKALDEFKNLQEAKPQTTKVSNEELVKFLSKAMASTKVVAAYLGVETGTAFSRLRRLEKSGVITRKYEGPKGWWVARVAVGLPVLQPEKKEGEEAA